LNEEIRNDEGEKRTHLEVLADPHASSPVRNVEQNEMKLIVQREIDRLPDSLRAVLLLFQFQELPYREIARILGISEKAVERRICHAREALRGKLSKYL
jgi:RNA polymerase sigma-70 factor (ECF subfamily)